MSESWFESLFGFAELTGSPAAWAATRARFAYDAATGALVAPSGAAFAGGRFATPSLAELRARGRAALAARAGGAPRAVSFAHAATPDVLAEHAAAAARGAPAVFLAASGLNCLEFTGPDGRPEDGVTAYEHDRTQGPACALAAAPGAVVRNYFSANSPDAQIDLIADVGAALAAAGGGAAAGAAWEVRSGYVRAPGGAAALDAVAAALAPGAAARDAARAAARVGVHDDVEVAFAARWVRAPAGARATQVYAAALSLGGYKDRGIPDEAWAPLATLVLEAAYEGALWAGVLAGARAGGRAAVHLTGLGLGVFGNKRAWVAGAVARAVRALRAEGADLDVVFLHYQSVDRELERLVAEEMGA